MRLAPLERKSGEDGILYPYVRAEFDRPSGLVHITVRGPDDAGDDGWPLALTRQLDDLILRLRANEPELGTWAVRTEGDPELVLAQERRLSGSREDWLSNGVLHYYKRTLKRLDVHRSQSRRPHRAGELLRRDAAGARPGLRRAVHAGRSTRRRSGQRGACLRRWNRVLEEHGIDFWLRLPHPGFNRRVGLAAGHHVTPDGTIVDEATWEASRDHWLPTAEDLAFVRSLMRPVYERGKIASWVAPPVNGINGKPFDYEYVRLV
ncbi:hypothetical protein ABT065_05360 [Streptomyces sp. NPDC002764]|uniref:hypothetical protein n=1 Tax=Streptomyces sp. NPDC002764 TaxID=3154428 RepID=UPI0033198E4C